MAVPASLIPELEEVLQHGSAERRARTLQRITTLFLNGADQFNEDHVALFDGVFTRLIEEIESKARAELSHRLAPVSNAPIEAVAPARQGRRHRGRRPGAGAVAAAAGRRPRRYRKTKSQAHLLAISGRTGIAEPSPTSWSAAATATSCAASPTTATPGCRTRSFSTLVEPGGGRRHAGREGRHASRHSAAAVPRPAAEGDRGRAAAPARRRQARHAGRNPARAGAGFERSRARADVARLRRRRAHRSRRCTSRASSTRRRWSISPRPANTRRWSRRCRGCARCRSTWSTA